jgi:hypothetical protein
MVPMALAAVERGDDVLVATGSRLSECVTVYGIPHAEVEHCGAPAPAVAEQMRSWGDMSNFHLFTTLLAPPTIREFLDCACLLGVSGRWRLRSSH